MKQLFTLIMLMFGLLNGFAQVTNIRTGLWSDNTIWSNNMIPVAADAVKLEFDVTVDINASCKSLTVNGHNVTVNSGVHLTISGEVSGTQLNDGLIAYYPFNGNATDSTGNGYDLIVQGALLTASRFGENQKAYRLNGISDFMIMPALLKADSLRELTISLWVNAENPGDRRLLLFFSSQPYLCSYSVGLASSDPWFWSSHKMVIASTPNSCTMSDIRDTISNPFNKWNHIVLVQQYLVDAFSKEYKFIPYLNGKRLPFSLGGSLGTDVLPTSFAKGGVIGGDNTSGNSQNTFNLLKGDIDDIRIYNRALSAEDVLLLYNLHE